MKRVVIGMSGGVDSAVSAYLLKKRGFDVIGVHMINWDPLEEGTSNCPRTKDESDARAVCAKLEIPFHTVNFVKEYWSEVFLKFLENYKIGRTTVPDIECNRSIKFEHFHNRMIQEFDADFIATGHYASTSFGDFQEKQNEKLRVELLTAKDPIKDQTYFLSTVRQEQLKRSIFPLGGMLKTDVKKIAEELGLYTVAKKAESMGICFVGKKAKFDEFIDEYIEEKKGKIIAESGEIIGEHNGIHHFTIGKRIHGKYLRKLSHFGYFVSDIEISSNNILAVEGSHNPKLYATKFEIEKPNWISGREDEDLDLDSVTCRIQRTHPAIPCSSENLGNSRILVIPRVPLRAAAPGQMCVFYKGNICLGGGEVQKIIETL
ncbi:unnamed protein product [Caenorhabditis angaria]|uniref:tRNA-5-taurinomethyluridine 2-sulfurtransferase n=1 Tax=Caenorhabditis angaria TaxID=860376 RepID=A0A9P1INY8_9PELO|nr:unnamed protein product [Caenorhabditis angaria]